MPKLKVLSGEQVIKILLSFGFKVASQRGSHIKLRRVLANGIKQTLTVPNHPELDRGTVQVIYKQALRYISAEDLTPKFFTT